MKKDIKEKLMIASALTTLASGIVLSFLFFFLAPPSARHGGLLFHL